MNGNDQIEDRKVTLPQLELIDVLCDRFSEVLDIQFKLNFDPYKDYPSSKKLISCFALDSSNDNLEESGIRFIFNIIHGTIDGQSPQYMARKYDNCPDNITFALDLLRYNGISMEETIDDGAPLEEEDFDDAYYENQLFGDDSDNQQTTP